MTMHEQPTKPARLFPTTSAVLVQFENREVMAPFVKNRAAAMLEVLGKPVIHHWLDTLANAGVTELTLFAGAFAQQIRQYVGRGERWGFEKIEFISTADPRSWDEIRAKLDEDTIRESVFVSLNAFPTEPVNRLARSSDFWFGDNTARCYGKTPAFAICEPRDLWLINMQMVARLKQREIEPGSFIDPAVRMEKNLSIGPRVLLEGQNKLENSVIGKDVRVAKCCEISHSVIFGNTRLGSHLAVDRMIIDGSLIYQVDSDCVLQVDDPMIATRLRKISQKVSTIERVLAGILLLLTCPLLVLYPKSKQRLSIFDRDGFNGTSASRTLELTRLDSASRFTQRIPWLAAVLKGKLPLFGSRELEDSVAEAPGVISLADFGEQRELDILIANNYQAHTGNLKTNLVLAGKWLPRAVLRSN